MSVVRALEWVQDMQAKEGDGSAGSDSILNVVHIDASGSVENVWESTQSAMDAYVKNDVLTAKSNMLMAIDICDVSTVAALSDEDELSEGVEPGFGSVLVDIEWSGSHC